MSPAEFIGHYRVVSKLGEGGMGAVYRATDTKLGRDVAIKVSAAQSSSETATSDLGQTAPQPILLTGGSRSKLHNELNVSSDGLLILAGDGEFLRIWETTSGRLVRSIPGIYKAKLLPDGPALITSDEHGIAIWNLKSARPTVIYTKTPCATFVDKESDGKGIWISQGTRAFLLERRLGAIRRRRPIAAMYDELPRLFCPHRLDGTAKVRCGCSVISMVVKVKPVCGRPDHLRTGAASHWRN